MLRTSKHTLKFCNKKKHEIIVNLINDYRKLVQEIIDDIWKNGYNDFSVQKNKLNLLSFLDSKFLNKFDFEYTERLKQCAGKQAIGMLSAATEKRRRQLWKLKQLQKEGINAKFLQRKINIFPLIKPNASNINLNLDSRFVDFDFENQNKFLCFVKLSSFKKGQNVKIPISHSSIFDKWNDKGLLKQSIMLSKNNIFLIFESKVPKKTIGETIGCDQGIIDVVKLSDNQAIPKYQDKYNLSDVQKILSRRKKGSIGFRKAQTFRKNIINWSINQLNFSNIKELRLEKLENVRKGKKSSRFLSHWTYTKINDKLKRVSEEKGFLIKEIPNEFRSQRCSECGWVRKANRKGKTFCCTKCACTLDADLNAASNLSLDLYEIPKWVRLKKINLSGFYWNSEGLFSSSQESIVPDTKKE